MQRNQLGPIAAVLACLWLTGANALAAVYAPKVGEQHPNFTLPRISNRQPMSLSQFRGRKVLLIQFASW